MLAARRHDLGDTPLLEDGVDVEKHALAKLRAFRFG